MASSLAAGRQPATAVSSSREMVSTGGRLAPQLRHLIPAPARRCSSSIGASCSYTPLGLGPRRSRSGSGNSSRGGAAAAAARVGDHLLRSAVAIVGGSTQQQQKQQRRQRRRRSLVCHAESDADDAGGSGGGGAETADLNRLQTALNLAIAAEDYATAARLRDELNAAGAAVGAADWHKIGLPEWLAERAERLGFKFPTEVQKRAAPVVIDGDDVLLRSATGSGKTMSFVAPALARLDYPPALLPEDLQGPELVIIVPTRELGVQIVMLIYKLFGGSVNAGIPGETSNMFNYSGPRGIKVRGVVLPEEVESAQHGGYLKGCHVVVGTPELLAQTISGPDNIDLFADTKVVVVDEVDECFKVAPDQMRELLDSACRDRSADGDGAPAAGPGSSTIDVELDTGDASSSGSTSNSADGSGDEKGAAASGIPGAPEPVGKPQVVFVGATVESQLAELAVGTGWMEDPISICVGAHGVPPGVQHRYIVVEPDRTLATMARQMRADLKEQGEDAPPARVMVFARSEDEAKNLTEPLRNVMWGDHKISVLLPGGEDPIRALHAFRDNKSTLLLATPSAARGLDLPALSHVYNIGLPDDSTAYLHRAGRVGRIGSTVQGVVTTLVTPGELPALQKMADELGVQLVEETAPDAELTPDELARAASEGESLHGEQLDKLRRGLEDLFNLY